MEEIIEQIKQQIAEHPILLYMKGDPMAPQCGFSARVVQTLMHYKKPFSYVNILQHPQIRSELPKFAGWPTFPQLWVNGDLVGGCDIIVSLHEKGELQTLLADAAQKTEEASEEPPEPEQKSSEQ